MKRKGQIFTTIVVFLVTVLNLYNMEREVPATQKAYDDYAYSYLLFMAASFVALICCYATRTPNRLTKALLIINAGAFILLGVKSYFHVAHKHNHYDITFLGCAIIIALYYLLSKHTNAFAFLKAILNQIYMRWPTKTRTRKPGSS